MSELLDKAAAVFVEKLDGQDIDAVVKFVVEDQGAVVVDATQSPPVVTVNGDAEAETTIAASEDVFQDLMDGTLNPTSAYMSGKLGIDGSMPIAMKLASALA
jgi:putative sterol carrier protein